MPIVADDGFVIRTILRGNDDLEHIERQFETLGFGQSGRQCPVCMEPRSKWVRFSYECKHDMCIQCAQEWLKQNKRPGGVQCPGCIAEHAITPKQVDPVAFFGVNNVGSDYQSMLFTSMQIPVLQGELDAYCMIHIVQSSSNSSSTSLGVQSRCPKCLSVHSSQNSIIRCHNPKCAVEYCGKCESSLCYDSEESMKVLRGKHLSRACSASIAETRQILDGPGLVPCSKCMTPLWHARHHGCHHVKCPNCGHEMCHCCGRDYRHPDCKCPIFCRNDYKCNCDPDCPECKTTKRRCVHCDGHCSTCMNNTSTS